MPQGGLEALNTKEPLRIFLHISMILYVTVLSFHQEQYETMTCEIMVKAFEIAGYTEEDLKEKFGALVQCIPVWCTTTRRYGTG